MEGTSEEVPGDGRGPIIWVVHGIVLYRCSTVKLRHVVDPVHDLET